MKPAAEKPSVLQQVHLALCWFGVIFAGGLFVTYVSEILTHENRVPISTLVGLLTFLAGIVFVCARKIGSHRHESAAYRELYEEQEILNRARQTRSPLTIVKTALDCKIRISEAKKAFERLALTGVCQIDVTEEGELCYRFPGFESADEGVSVDLKSTVKQDELA